jgi:hypothetical protein
MAVGMGISSIAAATPTAPMNPNEWGQGMSTGLIENALPSSRRHLVLSKCHILITIANLGLPALPTLRGTGGHAEAFRSSGSKLMSARGA